MPSGDETETVLRRVSTTLEGAVFRFSVADGPSSGTAIDIDGAAPGPIFFGSSRASDLIVEHPTVSRRHAAVRVDGTVARITDLQSKNGTFVSGVAVVEALLRGGEVLRLGGATVTCEVVDPHSKRRISPLTRLGRIVGASVAMRRLYPMLERLAASDVPVIIEGETGTGKEVVAESLHEASGRAAGPFVVLDCTTVAPSLMEATLFGHERGAFTGATDARPGVFERAHGGTLLIDEIGDLDISLQPKLLRAIERSTVQRVGGSSFRKVDVRVLAATRRDLEKEIQSGRFRDDLFYRLAVARVQLPALRERPEDIPLLAGTFWTELNGPAEGPPAEFLDALCRYSWPGNVRELYNAIAHKIALGDMANVAALRASGPPVARDAHDTIRPSDEPDVIAETVQRELPFVMAREVVVQAFTKRYLKALLDKHGGNVARAAEAAGIGKRYFYVLMGGAR